MSKLWILALIIALLGFAYDIMRVDPVEMEAAPEIVWQKRFGGTGNDSASSIQQTSDGGYIFVGATSSNDGGDYVWAVKLDASGALTQQKRFGGTGIDMASSIQQTRDGGYIFAGITTSDDGDASGQSHGNGDAWIVKLDAALEIEWQKKFGGSGTDWAYSIQQTRDGGYVFAGYTFSNDGDVSGNHGSSDAWVVKLDASGGMEWQKCFGGTGIDVAHSILQTSDGGYVFAGYTTSNDGNVQMNRGSGDAWVVKLDVSGGMEWQRCYGGSGSESAHSIQQTSDGGFIIAGYTSSSDHDVSRSRRRGLVETLWELVGGKGIDCWIVKLDAAGGIEWEKRFGGSGDDRAFSILQTSDEGFVFAGYTTSDDGDVTGHNGGEDIWVVKLDASGRMEWQKCLGGTGDDRASSIQHTNDGGFIVAGITTSNDGDVSDRNNSGGADAWIVKLAPEGQ